MPAHVPSPSVLMRDAELDHSSLILTLRRWFRRSPKPIPLEAQAASDDPRRFQPTSEGSGIFGEWSLDANGLPCYVYTLDQYTDIRARFPNSANLDRRDHWHQIGNDRVTGLASNDGTVQVYLGDRGGVFLNYFASRGDAARPDVPALSGLALLANNLLKLLVALATQILIAARRLWAGIPRSVTAHHSVTSDSAQARGVQPPVSATLPAQLLDYPSARFAYAGGFGYLECRGDVTATAFRYRQQGIEIERVFGMGYAETRLTFHNIRMTRRVHAPQGDYPFLLVDVEYENVGSEQVDFRGYEYWDVNVQQMKLQWLRGEAFATALDGERAAINDLFEPKIEWDLAANALRFRQYFMHDADPDAVSDIDVEPANIFLSDLSGRPDAFYVNKQAFFGNGDVTQPQAVRQCFPTMADAPVSDSMPFCMVMRRDFELAPGEKSAQRYAYGTVQPGASLEFHTPFPKWDVLAKTAEDWKTCLPYFHTGIDATLKREMAWHAYYLQSATVYNEYFKTHVTPQGSAYLYLHGADGVPRDQCLSTLPLVYLRPELARANLRLVMSLMDSANGALWYGFSGHGLVDNAVIHDTPSDLDLFFLMALNEYLSATGDLAFLDGEVPFYPPELSSVLPNGAHGTTVLDHVRCAINHLIYEVRRGDHGLIRMGDGDWSDGIVFENCVKYGGATFPQWFANSKRYGESIPNTQMALYVLPITQALLQERDPEFAEAIAGFVSGLDVALHQQWNGRWYARALLRDELNGVVVVDNEAINLEAQPWALISRTACEHGTDQALVKSITQLLDFPSKTGAVTQTNGLIWPAISQLLTWGYCRSAPEWAWRSLLRQTLAVHAEIFPETWVGIWTAPDALFTKTSQENPGGTWQSAATPMIDFPAMNSNAHAMPLLGLLRVCGVEPAPNGKGLLIDPHVPRDQFTLDMPLLRLDIAPGSITGAYRAIVSGERTLYVTVPASATRITVQTGKQNFEAAPTTQVEVPLTLVANEETRFEVRWQ
ncbi:MAG: hypothetical protein GC204_12075 [Chloroflexi bacterium]|nr:hypothetical protein [Chloroflexota bacterium]